MLMTDMYIKYIEVDVIIMINFIIFFFV